MKSFLRLKSVRIASALAIASGLAGTVGLVASTTSVTQAGADPADGDRISSGWELTSPKTCTTPWQGRLRIRDRA